MKTITNCIAALLLTFLVIQGCQKESTAKNGQLVASKSKVKINEPDSLLLVGAKASDSIRWSIVPSGYDTIITKNNGALIKFTKAGTYKVTATDKPANPASTTITVSDSVYINPNKLDSVSLKGDKITLTPVYFKNKTGDTTYLYFLVKTAGYYCNADRLNFAEYVDDVNNFTLTLYNLLQYGICNGATSQVSARVNFKQNQLIPLANGTFPLRIFFNQTLYTGSIVATSSTITFNWDYNTGVIIYPKHISR
jgi:hypothetical protein